MSTSEKVLRARAMFGLSPRAQGWHARRARRVGPAAAAIDRLLRAGETALITGPSGSGKSTLGRALALRCGTDVISSTDRAEPRPGLRVLDLFECDLEQAMSFLARAGLAEASVMVARERDLSEGQGARLAISLAMEKAGHTLILDEFGSTLDRPTAAGLCRTVSRWARDSGVRVVCITAHDDVLGWLEPAVLAVVGEGTVVRRRGASGER